ncbi:hypothetical protein TRFO_19809 [Tritrichomonas foetus]|uniref:Uncharacterized protein n=1 Tax=Tritrichomonas foetus TaxID=1144522 RepID=A0A1J4KIE9_9EUKA|nr:hypothetical protein TRFO_19809 [Tritrichomonas foetus]|eukprot:OHT10826.1 hypothetical protein TRFO_19809 [Tritrichomonas foetus]
MDDTSSLLENEISRERLSETIDQLRKENSQLKSQFDEAVSISDEVEKIHSQNNKLIIEVRQLKSEKEDLQRRLNISVQSNEEISKKFENFKKMQNFQFTNDQETICKEIDKIKQENENRIKDLTIEVETVKNDCEQKGVTIQLLKSKIDHALQNAERYFHCQVTDFDMLISILSKPTFSNLNSAAPNVINDQIDIDDSLCSKKVKEKKGIVKKYKSKIKKIENEKDDEIDELKRKIHELSTNFIKEKNDYLNQIEKLKEEKQNFESKTRIQITSLESKLESYKRNQSNAINNTKITETIETQMNKPNNIEPLDVDYLIERQKQQQQQQLEKQQQQQRKRQSEIEEQYLIKIEDLNRKLKNAEEQMNKYYQDFKVQESQKQKFELDFERVSGELKSLKIIHAECQNEIKTLRETLHSSNLKNKLNSPNDKKQIPINMNQYNLVKLNESQKAEIERLNKLRTAEQNEKTALSKKIAILENDLNACEEKLKKTQESFDEFCFEVQKQPKPTANDLLPPSAFSCPDLDKQLAVSIEKIAINASLQPSSKIRNSFKTIANYYEQKIIQMNEHMKAMNFENESLKQTFNKFLIDSSLVISDDPMTIDDLLERQGSTVFINKLIELKNKCTHYQHRSSYMDSVFLRFKELFGIDNTQTSHENEELMDQVEKFHHAFYDKIKLLKQREKQLKSLASCCNGLKKVIKQNEKKISELNYRTEELNQIINELTNKNDDSSRTIQSMKQQIFNVTQELEQAKATKGEMEHELKLMNENALAMVSNKLKEQEQKLRDELNSTIVQLNEASVEIKETDNQFENCKKLLQSERATSKKLEEEMKKLREEIQTKELSAQLRLKEEKKQLNESFERTFDQLRKQCELHRIDVQKLTKSLAESEDQIKQLKLQCSSITAEKNRLLENLRSVESVSNRQKKLFEASMKAKLMTIDTEYTKKLEAIQSENELCQRKMFSFIADSFRSYFNPCIHIDEKSFRIIVERVRQELSRLSDSDQAIRMMLNVNELQTTEDAVAQLLLDRSK